MSPHPRPPDPLPIYTLLRSQDVDMAVRCLASLHRHARDPFRHTILNDGSLTPEDMGRLREVLDGLTILSRAETDDLVMPALRDRPNCRRYREEHAFAFKLVDPPLLSGGAFGLCDSDVLFLRPFSGFDRRAVAGGEDIVYMKDRATAYSMSFSRRHWGRNRLRMPEFVNAGVLYVGPGAFDLDFVEWFLGQDDYRKYPWVMEQTAWAAVGGRVRPSYFDPAQVAFPGPTPDIGDRCIALHFLSPIRHRLGDESYLAELARRAAPHAGTVTPLETRPALFLGPARDILGRVVRRIRPPR